ncbi:hypothetical protein D3C72_2037470 [compost metagenome]
MSSSSVRYWPLCSVWIMWLSRSSFGSARRSAITLRTYSENSCAALSARSSSSGVRLNMYMPT